MDIKEELSKANEILLAHKNNIINKIKQADNLNERILLIDNLIDIDLKFKNYENMINKYLKE